MRTRDLATQLKREITHPTYYRDHGEKQAILALINRLERAELVLRQLRREAQHELRLPPGRVVTSGTVRRVDAERENAAKGIPGPPEVPGIPTPAQEGER